MLVICHMTHYIITMIRHFRQKWLEEFWNNGHHKKVPSEIADRLIRKLDMLNRAYDLIDLNSPPSNRLHLLAGDRKGQWVISVNGPWRLCFEFREHDAYNVELVKYH